MRFNYVPNTINMNKIDGINEDEFINLQAKYRSYFESILKEIINFKDLDDRIKKVLLLPKIKDKEYNFYHKYSTLDSDYIYLRNNIHIENLNDEEISYLKNNEFDKGFIIDTLSKVLFEEKDVSFFGAPVPIYATNSESIVFEFAFNQVALLTMKEVATTKQIAEELKKFVISVVSKELNVDVSFVIYNGINDIYKKKENEEQRYTV